MNGFSWRLSAVPGPEQVSLPGHCLSGHHPPGSECLEGYQQQEWVLGEGQAGKGRAGGFRAVVEFRTKCKGAWLGCRMHGRGWGQLHCCNDAPCLSFPICHMRSWAGLPVTQILPGPEGKGGAWHGCQGPEQRGAAADESRAPARDLPLPPAASPPGTGCGPSPGEGTSGTEQQGLLSGLAPVTLTLRVRANLDQGQNSASGGGPEPPLRPIALGTLAQACRVPLALAQDKRTTQDQLGQPWAAV